MAATVSGPGQRQKTSAPAPGARPVVQARTPLAEEPADVAVHAPRGGHGPGRAERKPGQPHLGGGVVALRLVEEKLGDGVDRGAVLGPGDLGGRDPGFAEPIPGKIDTAGLGVVHHVAGDIGHLESRGRGPRPGRECPRPGLP